MVDKSGTKKIFVINGMGGVGKDTFISFVEEYAKVMNYSSIDVIKDMARLVGWNGEKDEKSRAFLSDLKRVVNGYNRYPLKMMLRKIQEFQRSDAEFLFLHIREAKEIELLKVEYKLRTILIRRTDIPTITSNTSGFGGGKLLL